jgi:NADPH:quinone reductase-like Zn-dependent oxidoreductase
VVSAASGAVGQVVGQIGKIMGCRVVGIAGGGDLKTLRNAGHYISRLPKRQHDAPEWQAAIETLMLVVETGGPTMMARIGIMRALNRHVERVFSPDRKDHHWGRRKLARDHARPLPSR